MFGPQLSAADAVALEDVVVPRYLSQFASLLLDMMLPYDAARVVNLGCWHGYPDALVAEKMPGGKLVGVTSSAAVLEAARAKAAGMPGMQTSYVVHEGALPVPLPEDGFTHAFSLHPTCRRGERQALTSELRRLLVPGGQAMIALPLRGSFAELSDMGRECALKQDLTSLNAALDAASAARPTPETIVQEFEAAGLTDIDVDVQLVSVSFGSGREFLEDPVARLAVMPELVAMIDVEDAVSGTLVRYIHEAVSKYWSEGAFELTVNVGCASGRCP
ncbi:class I SAM-dependent methyltransferase [Chondromyces apiculatus]|uniref:Biotin synthesis protein BioC n=1 Tax=Chondromyces apiculatus DSM 436 TaxID=1192034 RepID=A0A017SZY8_9BACT|nr:class I SAM-dependent methyltransferase [Chondromyces apiculatus]EYF02332.1 Biotin synthesis protein BioC [Chondromyces apiculatus DSM 436]